MDDNLRVALRIDDGAARDAVRDAVFGAGRPAGVVRCESAENELIIDVNDATTPIERIVQIAAIELRRFGVVPRVRLLGDLSDTAAARIAGAGLGDPDLSPARIIETYLARGVA